jgi:ATP-binding cassette, subfamily B, bacterial PglK
MNLLNSIKQLWFYIETKQKTQFKLILLLMVFSSIAEVVSIGAVLPFLGVLISPESVYEYTSFQFFIEYLDLKSPSDLQFPLTVLFASAALLSGVLRIILIWAQVHLSHTVSIDLNSNIYKRTLYQPYSVHLNRNNSEIIAGITTKINQVVGGIILPSQMFISSGLLIIAILTTLIFINPFVAFSVLGFTGFIYILIVSLVRKRLLKNGKIISRESTNIVKALQEGLGGIREVLLNGTQEFYCKIYHNSDTLLRRAQANNKIISSSPKYGIEALAVIIISFVALYLTNDKQGVESFIPVLGALALGAQRLLPTLQQTFASWSSIKAGLGSLNDILLLLQQTLPRSLINPITSPISFEKNIKFIEIEFTYGKKHNTVLKNISFEIKKGDRVGIVGETGTGKSTLVDIIMGLLSPSNGVITVDDTPINLKNIRGWQSHISHVPQTIYLSDATIAENIAFGVNPDKVDMKRVKTAAKLAQISKTVESFENGYETVVGEFGVRLSGGQRQRIGIARALYEKSDVIIFDEATNALDSDTEDMIMQTIYNIKKDITIFIVAHRVTTLKKCNKIIKLEEGKVRVVRQL